MVVIRFWRGWTTSERAAAYQDIVTTVVIPGIEARRIAGFQKIDLLRRDIGDEVEFATIMRFESIDAVKAFMGEDYERAHVPAPAQAVLSRWDERSAHYEIVQERSQPGT